MDRPRSDVEALVAVVLVAAGAFSSFALLQSIATALDATSVGRLAPQETLGRLWVFFVLLPALLALVGVGIPCSARAAIAAARGQLAPNDAFTLIAIAVGGALVAAEGSLHKSGVVSLTVICAACLWRLRRRARELCERFPGVLLGLASVSLLGFGIYQQRLLEGEPASEAAAPTLFLLSYYASVVGIALEMVATHPRRRAPMVFCVLWLAVYLSWITCLIRCETLGTYTAGVCLGVLALAARAARRHSVDAGRPLL